MKIRLLTSLIRKKYATSTELQIRLPHYWLGTRQHWNLRAKYSLTAASVRLRDRERVRIKSVQCFAFKFDVETFYGKYFRFFGFILYSLIALFSAILT